MRSNTYDASSNFFVIISVINRGNFIFFPFLSFSSYLTFQNFFIDPVIFRDSSKALKNYSENFIRQKS